MPALLPSGAGGTPVLSLSKGLHVVPYTVLLLSVIFDYIVDYIGRLSLLMDQVPAHEWDRCLNIIL